MCTLKEAICRTAPWRIAAFVLYIFSLQLAPVPVVPVQLKNSRRKCAAGCRVQFTPTVQHCSMATLIGLSLRVKLLRSLHPRFKVCAALEAVLGTQHRYLPGLQSLVMPWLMDHLSGCVQVDIAVTPGGHSSEDAVNKQLNDKERVAAALENPNLLGLVEKCLAGSHQAG